MRVTPPDLEEWLTGYVRALAAVEQIVVDVSNKEPAKVSAPLTRPLIVLRDDSGPRTDLPTFDRTVGATVLAGTRQFDKPANDLARWLSAVLNDDAIVDAPGSPIASVDWDQSNGPLAVPEPLDVARRYQTVGYKVVGTW